MKSTSIVAAGSVLPVPWLPKALAAALTLEPLEQFEYGDVALASDLHEKQLEQTHFLLMSLSEDSLLKPLRQMSGQPAPGEDLGGLIPISGLGMTIPVSLPVAPLANGFRHWRACTQYDATKRRVRKCCA
jgi:hypothetical protein